MDKEFKSLEKQINTWIAFMTPKGDIHKEIKKMADNAQSPKEAGQQILGNNHHTHEER